MTLPAFSTGLPLSAPVDPTVPDAPPDPDLSQPGALEALATEAGLKPETSFGYDVGVEQSLLGDALSGGVTWFHNDIKNLIMSPDPT